jgi:hypothetical protein
MDGRMVESRCHCRLRCRLGYIPCCGRIHPRQSTVSISSLVKHLIDMLVRPAIRHVKMPGLHDSVSVKTSFRIRSNLIRQDVASPDRARAKLRQSQRAGARNAYLSRAV